jgi:hypothetical protein
VLPCDRDLVGNLRPPALDRFCLVLPLVFRFLVSNFAAPATLPATSCQLSANWLPGIKNLRVSKYLRTHFLLSLREQKRTLVLSLADPKSRCPCYPAIFYHLYVFCYLFYSCNCVFLPCRSPGRCTTLISLQLSRKAIFGIQEKSS